MYRSQERIQMLRIATTVAICILFSINGSHALSISRFLPCDFYDSVNITDGQRGPNGTITHDGVTYQSTQYAKVNYVWEKGTAKKLAPEHIRGCICNIKKCIRTCCPYGKVFNPDTVQCESHEFNKDYKHLIQTELDEFEEVALNDHFGLVNDRPCEELYEAGNYTIRHTGEIYFENETFHHTKYCVQRMLNSETNATEFSLLICFDTPEISRFQILPYAMLMSVPFIIATFFVYLCIPELCNIHGKCLLCYLFSLIVGYILMATVQLNGNNYMEPIPCKAMGYTMYFSFLSAFLWLSVISFNLWFDFRTTNAFKSFSERKRFGLYMIYAWGLAFVLTMVAAVLDSSESLTSKLKPGIGEGACFMKNDLFTQGLFFFLPLTIIFSVNIVFYVLTALKIRQVQGELKKHTSNRDSSTNQKNLNNKKTNFTLYLRLFIVMGVTWSMEAISFFISRDAMTFLVTDICNSVQGVVIFALFVLKRRVFKLIKNRWKQITGKTITNGSSATNSISVTRTSNLRLNQIERNDTIQNHFDIKHVADETNSKS